MQTLKKIPGMALESETIQGSFYVGAVEQPNPGLNIMKEIWKDIPGYKGFYQASNLGRIKSLTRYVNHYGGGKKIIKERILKSKPGSFGYYMVSLGYKNNLLIHRLVGLAFIPNPENKPCINHINGIKTDNRIENLGWCTYSENERHSYDVLGKKPNSGCFKKGMISKKRKPVAQYNERGILLNTFNSATEAAKYINAHQTNISDNCRGETKLCHGYIFKYL